MRLSGQGRDVRCLVWTHAPSLPLWGSGEELPHLGPQAPPRAPPLPKLPREVAVLPVQASLPHLSVCSAVPDTFPGLCSASWVCRLFFFLGLVWTDIWG